MALRCSRVPRCAALPQAFAGCRGNVQRCCAALSVQQSQVAKTSQNLDEVVLTSSEGKGVAACKRRQFGLSLGLALTSAVPVFSVGAEGEFATFYGLDTPPASYGGYGGNAKEKPKYTFQYPSNWKAESPSKVEKGTQGVDSRVVSPRKDQRAFVITLARAGEDDKSFRLTDLDSTLQGFAGADYNLQDALVDATKKTTEEREVNGIKFFDYDIDSPSFHYLSSVAVKKGKIFALFVRSPARGFKAQEASLRHIVESFTLL